MIVFKFKRAPKQSFSSELNGQRTTMLVQYNPFTDRWSMDIAQDGALVVVGIKMLPGTDLFNNLGLGLGRMMLYAPQGGVADREAIMSNNMKLVYVTEEEYRASISA